MQFKQFYLGCLAHASYYIGSGPDAAVIDPQRDVQQYIDEAEANGQTIRYIIETHSHADFVSGHIELAERTGAEIVFGKRADTAFHARKVGDGDELNIGTVSLRFMETPGHTPEGITVVASDSSAPAAPLKMFTGDTLFIGDVGRPDLIGSKGFTSEQMASMLFDSLHGKILKLADKTEVYPAHGAGSLCGKSLSKETWSTLGEQRKSNYALQPMSREEFVKIVAADQPEVPQYFPKSAAKNLQGAVALDEIPKPTEMSPEEVAGFDGIVIDVRVNHEFGAGHIPHAVNIGLGGQFASWAGTMVSVGTPIVVAAETEEQVEEAFMRLARVGIESVKGFILIGSWNRPLGTVPQVSVEEAARVCSSVEGVQLVDVRRPAEHANGHAAGALNVPLDRIVRELDRLDPEKPTYVICQSGYRSSLGASMLKSAGFTDVFNVTGGTQAWFQAGLETEVSAAACASRN
jgi:glyoxylase-like metal-dependent hydrolase (beta-lactamase superfamily II)/rhodanese-related sulfurtransferase